MIRPSTHLPGTKSYAIDQITGAEYYTAPADFMEHEQAMYETWLTDRLGGGQTKVTLG